MQEEKKIVFAYGISGDRDTTDIMYLDLAEEKSFLDFLVQFGYKCGENTVITPDIARDTFTSYVEKYLLHNDLLKKFVAFLLTDVNKSYDNNKKSYKQFFMCVVADCEAPDLDDIVKKAKSMSLSGS